MEYGLIKDTTLKSMADGLRNADILPKYVKAPYTIPLKSANATSLTDPTPIETHSDRTETIAIPAHPRAASIVLKITPGIYEHPNTTAAGATEAIAYVSVKEKSMNSAKSTYIYRTTTELILTIENYLYASMTFGDNNSNSSRQLDWCALNIAVSYLDADGNYILCDTDEQLTYTTADFVEALNNTLPVIKPEDIIFRDNLEYAFSNGSWDFLIEKYGTNIVTKDVTSLGSCFKNSKLTEIPFTINVNEISTMTDTFASMKYLTKSPKVRGNIKFNTTTNLDCIENSDQVRDFEDLFEPSMLNDYSTVKVTSSYSLARSVTFNGCKSMARIPSWFYKFKLNPESTAYPSSTYAIYNYLFNCCYILSEILDVPVWICQAPATSNIFSNTFTNAHRVSRVTFETNNGQPIVANWKSQTITLSENLGYMAGSDRILETNSDITSAKKVLDNAGYQALKNDPDWYTTDYKYSRYNHDSAVETINSLPDTSAYLASAGGTNTIKFKGTAGEKTDGGAINTLTAEEIAVATAKGWTVTLS